MIPRTYIVIGTLVGAICIAGASGAVGFFTGSKFKQGQWDAAEVAEAKGKDKALQAAAAKIANIKVISETHIQPLRTEIRTNTVYRDCSHSPDSLRHLNSLISGTESSGGGVMPQANGAH